MTHVRVLGIVLFVLGLWVFMSPFIGPVMHLYFSPPAMQMGMQHMGSRGGMNSNAVIVNRAILFFNFLPGLVLMVVGIYQIFNNRSSRFMS
ncbi:MAG: hypothetical protein ACYDER_05680 [Ktedonobacteraceae bacterium]